ncbi:FaeA/PapI family transcriptional regulator [Serratia marcescens]|uniref:FaeA/PapI family transcriptional regulator n=1 Tax=Serratia marcescens TaxID=615 RepID=UPI001F466315|nr:FaeA/PapI family transcriptional regulator [Serratia marcescens]
MRPPPPPGEWPTTRQLAESNDITIYQARNLLLNLAGRGKVLVTPGPVNKSLRWYPSL